MVRNLEIDFDLNRDIRYKNWTDAELDEMVTRIEEQPASDNHYVYHRTRWHITGRRFQELKTENKDIVFKSEFRVSPTSEMHYKRWRLLKAGDVVHLEESGDDKNLNHSFYGRVVLTSHEKSEESEAVNQFMIIEVCGDPLESKTFDVYSDTVFRLEQDPRKQNLKPLRTKWIETIEYVGNQVKTEDLDFSPFGKAFHDEVHEYCQGLKMEQEERLEQPERDAKWKNHSDAVNLFLSKHHMVQNQRWSLKFAREFLYKELIEFERYQRRETRAVVNEDPFYPVFNTSIEKFSVYSEEPQGGCASLAIMQIPVRLGKKINAEDATKRNFVEFAPRFPNLKRQLDSTIPSGDALSAPASKRARIEESSINDSSKIPSIQSLVELEAVTSSPSIRSLSDNSEASLPVAMDEDNDDEGMEIRKYPGSLTSKAIGTDHRGTKFLAPILSSTEHEAAKDWDPKKSKAFMAKVLRASREAMGPSNKDNSTKSTVPITVDSISDGSNYALRELCNVAKTALLIVKGKPFSESTTISRVEDATMEAPVQEEVVLQNDGRDRVESGASSTAPTRIENQGNWHRAGFMATSQSNANWNGWSNEDCHRAGFLVTSQSKSVWDGWSNEDKRGYRKLFPESKLERDLAISIDEMKTTEFTSHAALLEKLYLKIWCFIRRTMKSLPIAYCLSKTPPVPQNLPADIGSWRVRHFKDFVKQMINRLLLPQVATEVIQNKYFDNALEELFTVIQIKSVEVLINIGRSAI